MAERCEASLALDCAEAGAKDAVAVLRVVTPKRSGRLADSEVVNSVTGSGTVAVADYGPHTVYDEFRNRGGTIHVRNAKVLTDGVTFFGKSVTQAGSHYMEKGSDAARGPVAAACEAVLERFLVL